MQICKELYDKHKAEYHSKKTAGNELAFISREIADTCRIAMNCISGESALSNALNKTMKDIIEKELTR